MHNRALLVGLLLAIGQEASAQSAALMQSCVKDEITDTSAHTPARFRVATSALRQPDSVKLAELVGRLHAEIAAVRRALSDEHYVILQRRADLLLVDSASDFDVVARADNAQRAGYYVVFAGTADSIAVTDDTPVPTRRAICYSVLEARDVDSDAKLLSRLALASLLAARTKRWENFHQNGYSQFIVELAVNSWLGFPRAALEPPANQWIVLHPSLALAAPLPFRRGVHGTDAMLLEGLGVVHYLRDHTTYVGASAGMLTAVGERPGLALVAHYGKFGHVGVVLRKGSAESGGGNALIVSADLLKAINALPSSWTLDADIARSSLLRCAARQRC